MKYSSRSILVVGGIMPSVRPSLYRTGIRSTAGFKSGLDGPPSIVVSRSGQFLYSSVNIIAVLYTTCEIIIVYVY